MGDVDPNTGAAYGGPTQYVLRSRDRIVVDEAGMVDLAKNGRCRQRVVLTVGMVPFSS